VCTNSTKFVDLFRIIFKIIVFPFYVIKNLIVGEYLVSNITVDLTKKSSVLWGLFFFLVNDSPYNSCSKSCPSSSVSFRNVLPTSSLGSMVIIVVSRSHEPSSNICKFEYEKMNIFSPVLLDDIYPSVVETRRLRLLEFIGVRIAEGKMILCCLVNTLYVNTSPTCIATPTHQPYSSLDAEGNLSE
jgi:hypothetical protein